MLRFSAGLTIPSLSPLTYTPAWRDTCGFPPLTSRLARAAGCPGAKTCPRGTVAERRTPEPVLLK